MKKFISLLFCVILFVLITHSVYSQSSDLDGKWFLRCGPNTFNLDIKDGKGSMDEIGGSSLHTDIEVSKMSKNKYKLIRTGMYNQTYIGWLFVGFEYIAGYIYNKKTPNDEYPWHAEKLKKNE